MSEQTRSTDALAATVVSAAAAARAARNITRLRGNQMRLPRHPVDLDNLIEALQLIHQITRHLGNTVERYAHAVRWPLAGYTGSGDTREDYPRAVAHAAADAEHALTTLATQLRRCAPVGFSTDALASLDIALHDWRTRTGRTTGGA
jgi:hypothetical protein